MVERPSPIKSFAVDRLKVEVYSTRQEMGAAAAYDVAERVRHLFSEQGQARVVFAAAPSQNEFLAALATAPHLDWDKVQAFHMDEYVALEEDAPQHFGSFLRERLFDRAQPGRVEYMDGNAVDLEAECERYGALLSERPIDIVCAGIGENGHMAFNDPHVADFSDAQTVKLVSLDETCRMQQVHDGTFGSIDAVPKNALSMTMPALMSARWLYCVVPGPTKTEAVRRALRAPIAEACPATIMRCHPNAVLYLDLVAAAFPALAGESSAASPSKAWPSRRRVRTGLQAGLAL